MALAVAALVDREVSRIILTRPAVEAGERLGFLPGDMPRRSTRTCGRCSTRSTTCSTPTGVQQYLEKGIVEVAPLAFMRGRTLNDSFIILDEAQNTTPEQMQMFLTRLGFGSKVVVTGDVTQIDLPRGQGSGLIEVREILRDVQDIEFVLFDRQDVVRHKLVQRIVDAYRIDAERRGDTADGRRGRQPHVAASDEAALAALVAPRARRRRAPPTPRSRSSSSTPSRCRDLNREYRAKDEVTDVLAFPIDERDELPSGMPRLLGDVVICLDRCAEQAASRATRRVRSWWCWPSTACCTCWATTTRRTTARCSRCRTALTTGLGEVAWPR